MANVSFCFLKFFQCEDTLYYTRNFLRKNVSIWWPLCRLLRKKPLLIMSSLYGVANEDKEKSESKAKENIVHNVALATLALRDGNVEKSEKMLMKTLDLAETNNVSSGIISACDMLSSLAIKTGDYERAEDLLIKALDNLVKEGAPEDDNFVVSVNLKLCRIYTKNGNDHLAELGFKNCLRLQKSKLKSDIDEEAFLLWTTILYWYGKFLLGKSRFKEAKSCFQDCYESSLKVNLLPSQKMVILYNLGEACQTLGDHDEALEYFSKGVSLDKNCKNPDLSYFYTKLGTLLMFKGLLREARIWCDQGRKFAVRCRNFDAERESKKCLEKLSSLLG